MNDVRLEVAVVLGHLLERHRRHSHSILLSSVPVRLRAEHRLKSIDLEVFYFIAFTKSNSVRDAYIFRGSQLEVDHDNAG